MKIFYLQLQSSRHICPHTSIVDEKFLSTILKKAWWWCRPPWWGCWPSWWGCWPPWWWCRPPWGWWGPQKHCCGVIKDDCCTEGRPEIGNPKVWLTYLLTYQPTYQLTWVGARDTCVSKNLNKFEEECHFFLENHQLVRTVSQPGSIWLLIKKLKEIPF